MRAPEFWRSQGALARLLAPLGAGYDFAGRMRRSLLRPESAPVPVICAGNLVVGGAGKTPLVIALVERLAARGWRAHCLTRGYGGREAGPRRVETAGDDAATVGDEAILLARTAPTWIARDRVAGARAAAAAGAEAIVLDDGFQNPRLAKNLSLIAVDGAYGFGNGRVLPAGPLRETLSAGLKRAQAVVLFGDDATGVARALPRGLPLLRADLVPDPATAGHLSGQRLVAFAGIGRPEKFFATLRALGAELVEVQSFPDHHPYRAAEIDALRRRGAAQRATLVTTEKDAVRLPRDSLAEIAVLPVRAVWRDAAQIDALLDPVTPRREPAAPTS